MFFDTPCGTVTVAYFSRAGCALAIASLMPWTIRRLRKFQYCGFLPVLTGRRRAMAGPQMPSVSGAACECVAASRTSFWCSPVISGRTSSDSSIRKPIRSHEVRMIELRPSSMKSVVA